MELALKLKCLASWTSFWGIPKHVFITGKSQGLRITAHSATLQFGRAEWPLRGQFSVADVVAQIDSMVAGIMLLFFFLSFWKCVVCPLSWYFSLSHLLKASLLAISGGVFIFCGWLWEIHKGFFFSKVRGDVGPDSKLALLSKQSYNWGKGSFGVLIHFFFFNYMLLLTLLSNV